MKTTARTAAAILAIALAAQAGVTLTQTMQQLGEGQAADTNVIRLDKDKVRIDIGRKADTYMIYDGAKRVFLTVDANRKSYMEVTEKDFEAMHAKMDEAMVKMREQMKNMPPERRKMMEDMMAKMGGGTAKVPKTEFRKLGDGGKVGQWSTTKYEGSREGAKVSEVWTASPKSVGIRESDVEVLKDMGKFFGKFSKGMPDFMGDKDNGLEGLPIKTVSFKDGKPQWQSELTSLKKGDLASSLFEVPAGYTQTKMGRPEKGG